VRVCTPNRLYLFPFNISNSQRSTTSLSPHLLGCLVRDLNYRPRSVTWGYEITTRVVDKYLWAWPWIVGESDRKGRPVWINARGAIQWHYFDHESVWQYREMLVRFLRTTLYLYYLIKTCCEFENRWFAPTAFLSCADPVGKVSWILFQEGRNSELRLRRGVGQAAHTLNNPQVECTGVLLCVIRE